MSYFYNWFGIFLASLLASMIPGLSFALVLRNTMRFSRTTGIWTAFGLALGISIYVVIVVLGLSILILKNIYVAEIIKWGGAAYLAYVGVKSILAKPRPLSYEVEDFTVALPIPKAISMGLLTNLLNPKVALFFLALFTQFISPTMPTPIQWLYGLTVAGVEFMWFTLVSVLLTHPLLNRKFNAYAHWIERGAGAILILISLKLVLSHVF